MPAEAVDLETPFIITRKWALTTLFLRPGAFGRPRASGFEGGEQPVEALLGVPEQHHALGVVVQVVVHAGEAGAQAPLEHDDRLPGSACRTAGCSCCSWRPGWSRRWPRRPGRCRPRQSTG